MFKYIFLINIFIIFLWPASIWGGSSNYSFVLLAVGVVLLKGSFKTLSPNLTVMILFYTILFLVSTLYQFEFMRYLDRRVISFIIFMTMFSYVIINIDQDMVRAFKIATVLLVIYFIIHILKVYFFELGGAAIGFSAKGLLGNHRYGFVYLLAFWILMLNKSQLISVNILRIACIFIILSGSLLTFSRSVIIGLVGSLILFYLSNFINRKNKLSLRFFLTAVAYLVFLLLFIILLHKFLPLTFNFFDQRLLSVFSIEGFNELFNVTKDKNSSEGFRLFLLGKILNFVSSNPFTGSGFLGCWIMFEDLQCSAHSQYNDVLFRTGIFGFSLYILILFNIFKYLKSTHQDLFWGFVSILIYGIFHETFKQSHGAFILAFLFGMMITAKRNSNL